ncbi:Dynein regulatory complex subunit 6, partial [Gonapodya sp. JEL0774]
QATVAQRCQPLPVRESPLHRLPPEILRLIVRYLPFRSFVQLLASSRNLRSIITSDRTNFSKVDFSSGVRPTTAAAVKAVAKWGGSRIRILDLGRASGLDDAALKPLVMHMCDGVVALRLESARRVTASCISTVSKIMRNLRVAVLRDMHGVDDACVRMLVAMCSQLDEIDLTGCERITDGAFAELGRWSVKRSVESPAIRAFTLAGIPNITDVAVRSIVSTCGDHLRVLRIPRTAATRRALLELAAAPNLSVLDVSGCNLSGPSNLALADAVVLLVSSATELVEFRSGGVPDLDDSALGYVADSLRDLQVLDLNRCAGITSGGLLRIGVACRKLRDVNLSWCPGMGTSLDMVLGAMLGPALESLDLSHCVGVTDATLILIGLKGTGVTRLRIAGCVDITSAGVSVLAGKRGDPLQFLDLDGCTGISRDVVMEVIKAWPKCLVRAGLGGQNAKMKGRG